MDESSQIRGVGAPVSVLPLKVPSMSSDCGCVGSVLQAQQNATNIQIQFSVMAKQLEAHRQAGQAATDLLAAALQLSKEAGKGESFDGIA